MFNLGTPNQIEKCSKCGSEYFIIAGFESQSSLGLYLSCEVCGELKAWYSSSSNFFDKFNLLIECPHCHNNLIEIIGEIKAKDFHKIIMQCNNYLIKCKFKFFRIQSQPLKIKNKGFKCHKCGDFSVISSWDKNKGGYWHSCVNQECNFKDFESV